MRKERGTYIGGHQISALMGMHPFMSEVDVWVHSVNGDTEDISEQPAVRRGRILEPGFLDWIQEKHVDPKALFRRDFFVVDKEFDYFAGTIDAAELDEKEQPVHLHEVTTTTSWSLGSWGESGDPDGASTYKWMQAQWYMGITGAKRATIWLFVADNGDIRRYDFARNDESILAMRTRGQEWWQKHVVLGFQPDVEQMDDSTLSRLELDKFYKADADKNVEPTSEIINLAYDYQLARKEVDEADKNKKLAAAKLKVLMKDGVRCKWDGGSVSWTQNKSSQKVDYEAICAELFSTSGMSEQEIAQVKERHTVEKPGPRVMRVTVKDKK